MRRLIAFITMAVSILLAILFNTQVILDNKVLSAEYGGGTEFVYKITEKHNSNGSTLPTLDVESELMERFELTNSSNGDLELVSLKDDSETLYYELRLKVGANTTNEINAIDEIMGKNGSLSFCTSADYCVTQKELLQEDEPATVLYSGVTPYPVLQVSSKTTWDDLVTKAGEATIENTSGNIYVWMNKFDTDTYESAYDADEPDYTMQNKIITTLTSDSYNESTSSIIISTDKSGQAFNLTSSRSFVTAINAKNYNFEIEKLYSNKFGPTLGDNALVLSLVGILVVYLAAVVLLCIFYGMAGFISSISLLATQSLLVSIFSFLGFAISPAAFVGMIVTLILGVFISVNYFERVKDELRKPRHLDKANREGYHKSYITTVDSCLMVLITSVFSFILANGMLQTLAAVALIGSLFTFLITNYFNKWMMYWFTSSDKYKDRPSIYGLSIKQPKLFVAENTYEAGEDGKIKNVLKTNIKPKKNMIIGTSIASGVAICCLASMLTFGIVQNKVVNYSSTYVQSTYLNIQLELTDADDETTQDYFLTEESFTNFLANNNNIRGENEPNLVPSEYTNVTYNVVEQANDNNSTYVNTIYVSYEVPSSVITTSYIDSLKSVLNGLELSSENKPLVNYGDATPIMTSYEVNNFFLVSCLVLIWSLIYIFARFGISSAVASLFVNATTLLFGFGITSLFRIPFNSFTGYAFLAVALIASFLLIPIFNRNKEILKDRKLLRSGTKEDRLQALSQSLNYFLPIGITSSVICSISFVLFLAFVGESVIPLSIIVVLSVLFAMSLVFWVAPCIYYLIRCNLNFSSIVEKREQKRLEKKKKPSKRQLRLQKYKEEEDKQPHETIIIGINEFR